MSAIDKNIHFIGEFWYIIRLLHSGKTNYELKVLVGINLNNYGNLKKMHIVKIDDSEVNFVWKFEAKMTEILRYYVMLTVGYK